ncbi:MAG: phosphatidate cytidylyltransferase [Candidatus Cloacimonetes bacterium]|nr:phosphatidate cytidylyltransferase [Candidatus Cloacimonadota bacterium]
MKEKENKIMKEKDLTSRILVAVIFMPILLFIYYKGGSWLFIFAGCVSLLCTYELCKMIFHSQQKQKIRTLINMLLSASLCSIIARYDLHSDLVLILLFTTYMVNGVFDVFCGNLTGSFVRIAGSLLAVAYPAIGMGLLYRLHSLAPLVIIVLAVLVWINDSAAYFIGKRFGRHKGIFLCSPKKSLEGFVGGFLSVVVTCAGLYLLFPDFYSARVYGFMIIAVGIFGQFGDLFESILKRDMNIKDSSHILPGHGGILDRFDSLLVAAPIFYILMTI